MQSAGPRMAVTGRFAHMRIPSCKDEKARVNLCHLVS